MERYEIVLIKRFLIILGNLATKYREVVVLKCTVYIAHGLIVIIERIDKGICFPHPWQD